MNLIIGISGHIGAGKTTFSNFLKEELLKVFPNVIEKNFADKLKKICFELTGYYGYTQFEKNIWIDEYNMTVGSALQVLGTEVMRNNFDKDVWVKSTFIEINKLSETIAIIGDCRFHNEAEAIKNKNGIVIRLNGDPAKVNENTTRDKTHPSETDLDNYKSFDFIYNNIGSVNDLLNFAKEVVEVIKHRHLKISI